MPIYHHVARGEGCDACRDGIDALQKIADPPLRQCPKCAAPLERVISAAQVVSGQAHRLGEAHAAKHGFTQYRRAGKGVYEKTAGKGPKIITGD